MKTLKSALILLMLVGVSPACDQASYTEPERITYVILIDRSSSMEDHLIPSVHAYVDHIKKDIAFHEASYFGNGVTFYILPINHNLVNKPKIVEIDPGVGEWDDSPKDRLEYVQSKLAEVEKEITIIVDMTNEGSTEFYSSMSFYLSLLSELEGKRKISIVTDAMDNRIAPFTKNIQDPVKLREIYPGLIDQFSNFHDLSKYDLSGIETEIVHSFDGDQQNFSYEMMLFFDYWLTELKVAFSQPQTI